MKKIIAIKFILLACATISMAQEIKINSSPKEVISTMQSLGYKKIDSSFSGQTKKRCRSVSSPYLKKFGLAGSVNILFDDTENASSIVYLFNKCIKDDFDVVVDSINCYYGTKQKPIDKDPRFITCSWIVGDTMTFVSLGSGQVSYMILPKNK